MSGRRLAVTQQMRSYQKNHPIIKSNFKIKAKIDYKIF